MRYLSVCSGIEAASVAWHPLGWSPVAFAEIEKFPSAVLKHHYPDVPNWDDMTKFKDWPDAAFDVLVGGTPCQSFSVAGLRKGMDDPRGNLALTYLAILDRYRPTWCCWENVPGVLSSGGGRDFGAFLGGLGEFGYGWAYRILDAQYFGLAQRRKRVFVVANLRGWQRAAAVLFDSASLRGDSAPRPETGQGATPILEAGARTGKSHGAFIPEVVGTLSDGAHMGGGLNGQDAYTGRIFAVPLPYLANPLTARMGKGINTTCDEGQTLIPCGDSFDAPMAIRTANTNANGHGVSEGVAHTLDRAQGQAIAFRTNQTGALDTDGHTTMQVRRLTPRECEKLQGFSPDYTLIPYRGKPAADGPRYKALGNSMAVPVMAWIGRRIQMVTELVKEAAA